MGFVPPKGTLIGRMFILPHFGGYQYRIGEYSLANGEKGHTVVKVKNEDIEKWDTEHAHIKGGLSGAGYDDEVVSEVHLVQGRTDSNSEKSLKKNADISIKA
ncbi:unnamed protein product [Ambrosiozyma monospora]|uniref:Unnamed protein product n=1 Tax=Ambrosiozyma monospora TaxID=43982 RepID=A0ACB5UCB4_AMBMO|nr:unnamed protein product [Ambrosiozyma monospora]